jgi:hypothetical protein
MMDNEGGDIVWAEKRKAANTRTALIPGLTAEQTRTALGTCTTCGRAYRLLSVEGRESPSQDQRSYTAKMRCPQCPGVYGRYVDVAVRIGPYRATNE